MAEAGEEAGADLVDGVGGEAVGGGDVEGGAAAEDVVDEDGAGAAGEGGLGKELAEGVAYEDAAPEGGIAFGDVEGFPVAGVGAFAAEAVVLFAQGHLEAVAQDAEEPIAEASALGVVGVKGGGDDTEGFLHGAFGVHLRPTAGFGEVQEGLTVAQGELRPRVGIHPLAEAIDERGGGRDLTEIHRPPVGGGRARASSKVSTWRNFTGYRFVACRAVTHASEKGFPRRSRNLGEG